MRRCDLPLATNVQRRYVVTTRQQLFLGTLNIKLPLVLTRVPEEFDPDRMECINIDDMIRNSPFEKKIVEGREQSVLKEPTKEDEAIVKIVAFPGLVVHR